MPLSRQAIDLLRSCLPTDDAGNARRRDPSALIFATSSGAPLGNWDRETKRIIVACGLGKEDEKTGAVSMKDDLARWTCHDLRRTGATMFGEMGESGHHRSRAQPRLASVRRWLRRTTGAGIVAGGRGAATAGGCAGWD